MYGHYKLVCLEETAILINRVTVSEHSSGYGIDVPVEMDSMKQKVFTLCAYRKAMGRPVSATITLYPIGRPVRATITLYPIGRPVRVTITLYPIGRPVRATITLYPIGRPVRATITLYPIGRPVRATITLYYYSTGSSTTLHSASHELHYSIIIMSSL